MAKENKDIEEKRRKMLKGQNRKIDFLKGNCKISGNGKISVVFSVLCVIFSLFLSSCNFSSEKSEPEKTEPEKVAVQVGISSLNNIASEGSIPASSDIASSGDISSRSLSVSRNILPDDKVTDLTDIRITGSYYLESLGTMTIKEWADYAAFQADPQILLLTTGTTLTSGAWTNITLTAKLGGEDRVSYSGRLENVQVTKRLNSNSYKITVGATYSSLSGYTGGTEVDTLSFALSCAESPAPSYGGMELTLKFKEKDGAPVGKVTGRLETTAGTPVFAEEVLSVDGTTEKSVKYIKSKNVASEQLIDGYYRLVIDFYTGSESTGYIPLNSYSEYVRIKGGFTSRDERSIDLNGLYEIEYISNGGTIEGSAPASYSLRSPDIALPLCYKNLYIFTGWYLTTDGTTPTGSALTAIPQGTGGDIKLIARFIQPKLYVKLNGTAVASDPSIVEPGFTMDNAFGNLQNAVDYIGIAVNTTYAALNTINGENKIASREWTIKVSGKVKGTTIIDGVSASKLNIVGNGSNDIDILDGNGAGPVVYIKNGTNCEIYMSNLGITGGSDTEYGGGLRLEGNFRFLGSNLSIYSNTASAAGGGIYAKSCYFSLNNSTVRLNTVTGGSGGGLAADSVNYFEVSGSYFFLNTAQNGGALYVKTLIGSSPCLKRGVMRIFERTDFSGTPVKCESGITFESFADFFISTLVSSATRGDHKVSFCPSAQMLPPRVARFLTAAFPMDIRASLRTGCILVLSTFSISLSVTAGPTSINLSRLSICDSSGIPRTETDFSSIRFSHVHPPSTLSVLFLSR